VVIRWSLIVKIIGKMNIDDLQVYKLSMELSDKIWLSVGTWKYFEKDTLGKQLVRAADSIAANLSEGFGRYSFKENQHFCYYSRGSLYETRCWLTKAYERKLISEDEYLGFNKEIDVLGVKLNNYIKSIGNTPDDNK